MRQKLTLSIPTSNDNIQQLISHGFINNKFGAVAAQDKVINDGVIQNENGKVLGTLFYFFDNEDRRVTLTVKNGVFEVL